MLALFDALSMHSDIRIVASHLGMLDVRHVEVKGDVGVDPEDGVLSGTIIRGTRIRGLKPP